MKSGIYKITCLVNSKIYIGSTTDLNFRWKQGHLRQLKIGIHYNSHLQNSFDKYIEENFKFEVIEYCEKDQLIIREQHYIDTLKPHFNIRKIAESNLGLIMSDEQKQALSNHFKGKPNPKNKGPKSEETKEKLRIKLKGRIRSKESIEQGRQKLKGKPKSPEHIEKVRQANLGKKRSEETLQKLRGRKRSEEFKEHMSNKTKAYMDSLTEEQKINRANKISQTMKNRFK